MPKLAELLEREGASVDLAPGDFERLLQRRERKRRNERIAAGALAIVIALVSIVTLTRAFRSAERLGNEPTPRPTPATLGALAYAEDGDIFVAAWDGSKPIRIADGRPPSECGTGGIGEYFAEGPIWSPDGRYLAYRHKDCNAPRDAWWGVVISDRHGNVVTSFPSEGWGISWSPDATRVAVWVRWTQTIGIYGLDGVRQRLLTLPFLIKAGEGDPVWSPDGRSLHLADFEIPLDGSTPRRLPWSDGRVGPATYSPDGSRVVFASRSSLVIAEADGSGREVVFEEGNGSLIRFAAWSPTGDRIAFTAGNNTELRLLDVATGRVTLLTETDGSSKLLVIAGAVFEFSPEGNRILFSSTEDGAGASWLASSLWSVNDDGSDLRRLVAGTALGDWLS